MPHTTTDDILRRMFDAYEHFDLQWRLERGLSANEGLVITQLWARGSASMGDIAHGSGLTSGGTTSLIDRLEREGHVRRTADPNDRRRNVVVLTDGGATMRAPLDAALRTALDSIDPEAARTVAEALDGALRAGAEQLFTRMEDRGATATH